MTASSVTPTDAVQNLKQRYSSDSILHQRHKIQFVETYYPRILIACKFNFQSCNADCRSFTTLEIGGLEREFHLVSMITETYNRHWCLGGYHKGVMAKVSQMFQKSPILQTLSKLEMQYIL